MSVIDLTTEAFVSYTHLDNDADDEQIAKFVKVLRDEYRLVHGSPLEVFFDRDALAWGSEWEDWIFRSVAASVLFIPIVTPSYLQSDACRREYLRFASDAERLGVARLILPVLWITSDDVVAKEPTTDEVVTLTRKFQWRDLRAARLLESDSREFRRHIHDLVIELGQRLDDAIDAASRADVPASPPVEREANSSDVPASDSHAEEDAPGMLEVLADGQDASERSSVLFEELGQLIEEVGNVMGDATAEIEAADRRGDAIRARLRIAAETASRLSKPAQSINDHGTELVQVMRQWDDAVQIFFDTMEDQAVDERRDFLETLVELQGSARESLGYVREMHDTAESLYGLSKQLRKPLMVMNQGLRSVADSEGLINGWADRARAALEALPSDDG